MDQKVITWSVVNTDTSKANFPEVSIDNKLITKASYIDAINREYKYTKEQGAAPLTVKVTFKDGSFEDFTHAKFEKLTTSVF